MSADKPDDVKPDPASSTPATPPAGDKPPAAPATAAKPADAAPAKPAAAAKKPAKDDKDKKKSDPKITRRKMVWASTFGVLGIWSLATLKFFFPRVLFEPSTRVKIGFPDDFGLGVDTKFQQAHRIWVVRDPSSIFVIFAQCTHLGCTPDWKESENKFKCPCHGSGFDSEGVNFEGPAPRPMDRTYVELDPEGQIVVDKSRLYGSTEWSEKESYVPV